MVWFLTQLINKAGYCGNIGEGQRMQQPKNCRICPSMKKGTQTHALLTINYITVKAK